MNRALTPFYKRTLTLVYDINISIHGACIIQ